MQKLRIYNDQTIFCTLCTNVPLYVTKDGNELKINKAMKKTLNAFASFLDGKGELDKDSDKMKVEIPESDNEDESVENT